MRLVKGRFSLFVATRNMRAKEAREQAQVLPLARSLYLTEYFEIATTWHSALSAIRT